MFKEYIIVRSVWRDDEMIEEEQFLSSFRTKVEKLMLKGWQPQGGLAISGGDTWTEYAQVMVK